MSRPPATIAILLAGGSGSRAGRPKQFARAQGRSILEWACAPFAACREVGGIVVVGPAERLKLIRRHAEQACTTKLVAVVAGGRTRHLSSRAGLAALPPSCRHVLIHDVARPFADAALIRRVLRAAKREGAAIPVTAMQDSIVRGSGAMIENYAQREAYRIVQTPQAFSRPLLEESFEEAGGEDYSDDAMLVAAAGHDVAMVEGVPENTKITTAAQLQSALAKFRRAN